jgi:signal transduction histidine kinase
MDPGPQILTPDDPSRISRVRTAQADAWARKSRSGTLLSLLGSVVIAALLAPAVGLPAAALWFAGCAAAHLLRDLLVYRARARRAPPDEMLRLAALSSAVLGLALTAPAPLFFAALDPNLRAIYTAVQVAWVAAAALIVGVHPLSYRLYMGAALANIAFGWWLAVEPRSAALITLLLVLAAIVLWRLARQFAALLESSTVMRHEKEILVDRLRSALTELEAAQNTRARFLAAAGHDLLQPVHALLMLVGVLRQAKHETQRAEAARHIELTAESIETMFRGLLDLARIDAGTLNAQLAALRLQPIVQSIAAGYEMRCAQRGVQLHWRCAPGLAVHADAALLTRVLRNLVDNAVKFTPQGRIDVVCEPHGDGRVELRVADSGIGIHPDDLAHVEEAFFRGRSCDDVQAEGIGLGLAVTAHMVGRMGGTWRIESVPKQGTVVHVLLAAADGAPAALRPPRGTPRLRHRKVVLIEDDAAVRGATQAWLAARGCDVIGVASLDGAERALAHRAPFVPELVLADFHLADGPDGLQAIAAMRARHPGCAAALVTGAAVDPQAVPDDVVLLAKPLRAENLEALLLG